MKKILILIIIIGGIGMYTGNLLTNKINHGDFSWGSAKDTQTANGSHVMPDGTTMDNMGNVTEPMSMEQMMVDMNKGLENKTGSDFDKEFLAEMIVHHQGAVDMAKQVLAKSKRPELLKLANDIVSAQTKEINMMKAWQTAWFATSTRTN